MKDKNATNPTSEPYLEEEFETFIKLIGDKNIENWTIMAEAIGVGRDTIVRWRKHPKAKEAINASIAKSIASMEKVGARDWKMHREKLKMLGLLETRREEHTGENGEPIKFESLNDEQLNRTIESKLRKVGVGVPPSREGKTDEREST